ncbi:ABC transporter substrate-binding protein [Pseudomonas brassicacearum]|uniref:DUF2076 domain-containing protein n=1 Tax=Pseudomonas brassicacearum TaxID=930166 RepID=UPI000F4627E2|nr:DUF2076 domain-containing protein [Pseudomonas brassicacearum]ROM68772.1 ABC transporter substrate-binding protein [Pseudomonas brassicacearum]
MNSEEQTLIDGLFSRLQQAEKDSAPRDAQAEARIKEHMTSQPAAGYFMAQAILVQEAAIKRLDEQNKQLAQQVEQLQAELQQARNPASAPSGGGGFLSSIFGGGTRDSRPASAPNTPASGGGGWREPARPAFNAPAQQGFGAPPGNYGAPQQQAPAASSFLGGALKTAAGVAGGVMLAQSISSLFHSSQQPQEIVEVIKEEPAQPVNDTANSSDNGWGDDQRVADNDTYGSDQGGFSDADYSDDSSFLGDDDSFV